VQVVEKRKLEDLNCCGSRNWVLGWYVWRVDKQWVISPCELIASARGWPAVERKMNNNAYGGEVHPSFATSWLIINI
jgi:hypothetical protein